MDRGRATLAIIEQRFYLPERGVYLEVQGDGTAKEAQTAYNWSMGIQLSALTAAAKVDGVRYLAPMKACVSLLDKYWIVADGIGGYSASYRAKAADRYYDDNAWVVLGLIEAYELTKDAAYLQRAESAEDFVLSGEDKQLGGGLYWRESEKSSKNTCANAPAIVGALRLFQLTDKQSYRHTGVRLYEWTVNHLQDPADGLFYDHIGLDGAVDKTKFSYNSALMIRANLLMGAVTGEAKYAAEARHIGESAAARWFKPDGKVADEACFAHLLAEALLELGREEHDAKWEQMVRKAGDFVWNQNRDAGGRHPKRWDDAVSAGAKLRAAELKAQASAARLFFRLAANDILPDR